MQVDKGTVVGITYRCAIPNGESIEQSRPVEVFIGGGRQVPPGIQDALIGHGIGDTIDLELPPEEGYGRHDPTMVLSVPRHRFPAGVDFKPGMLSSSVDEDGNTVSSFSIVEVRENAIVCDYNHPLAGVTTHWRVRVASVREANAAERRQGYVCA